MGTHPRTAGDAAINLALKLEQRGDLAGALRQYEAALALSPNDVELVARLAGLASQMGLFEVAAELWLRVTVLEPGRLQGIEGRARALREIGRFGEAIATLRQALLEHPEAAELWNSLGVTLVQEGRPQVALTFFDEAVRLRPGYATALYNRGGAYFDVGRLDAARDDFKRARAVARRPEEAATIDFATATLALARGDLIEGWEAYEVRLSPHWPGSTIFRAPGQQWEPSIKLAGRRLLVIAGQGLGDEIMFSNLLPDLLDELGPRGSLTLAVEPRLIEIYRRSFPNVEVIAHATDRVRQHPRRTAPGVAPRAIDLWTPLASLCRRFRRRVEDFPSGDGYLRPDPARVRHWRAWLGDGAPAVGLTWRSGKVGGDRRRLYPAPEGWRPVLEAPGVRFVNLQYGDFPEDLQLLGAMAGREILQPPDLDLKNDLEGLAALSVALDLVAAVPNATAALAGACGAGPAIIGAPCAWPRLGTPDYPWYPGARSFAPEAIGEWEAPMGDLGALVRQLAALPKAAHA